MTRERKSLASVVSFLSFRKMDLAEQIFLAGRFTRDLANVMTREEIVALAGKLMELEHYEEVESCGFTKYVVARIIERHYKNTDIL